ncbi:beta-ketoacyl synthase N-terminal-like domain-containing protein [Tistrella bauzanensis]
MPSLIPNMAASMLALRLGFEGPQATMAGACASGTQAIGYALAELRAGRIDWALAGGSEAVTTPITWSGFEAMHALARGDGDAAPPVARPFDARRDGMICGEGRRCCCWNALPPPPAATRRFWAGSSAMPPIQAPPT